MFVKSNRFWRGQKFVAPSRGKAKKNKLFKKADMDGGAEKTGGLALHQSQDKYKSEPEMFQPPNTAPPP